MIVQNNYINNYKEKEKKDMNQKERMLAGLPYKAWLDGLSEERTENKLKIYEYNLLHPNETNKMSELFPVIITKRDNCFT